LKAVAAKDGSHSESLPALLAQLRLSVLISTYQTGHLVVVAARQGRLVLTCHQFERAMGIAVKPGTIAVCTRKEVWFLRDAPDVAAKLQPPGHHDACFLACTSHFTGDIEAHESARVGSEFWIVQTMDRHRPHDSELRRFRAEVESMLAEAGNR